MADLLNLDVDLIYFNTTSTHFEIGEEDAGDEGCGLLRRRSLSKDHRPDLPQAVIGLAVTRDGIPVRCWVWPSNTADVSVIKKAKKALVGWRLGRVVTVTDHRFDAMGYRAASDRSLRCSYEQHLRESEQHEQPLNGGTVGSPVPLDFDLSPPGGYNGG